MLIGKSDITAVAALSPRDVAGYLRSRGWQDSGPYGSYGRVFASSRNNETFEVILSTTNDARDFSRRMVELVDEVARFEDRSPYEVVADLTLAPFDVVRIRLQAADQYGSIKISEGVELHEEARNLMLWAANAAASPQPRKSWKGRRFEEVGTYLDSVRLGQTQRGSFVLTLLSPWHFDPTSAGSLDVFETFGRRTTQKLASALVATQEAIRKVVVTNDLKPFDEAVTAGVSSNLCTSLARLAEEGNGMDVTVDWSPSKPADGSVKVSMTRENASILAEAARHLDQQEPDENVTIQGLVSQITEDPDRFDGNTVIETKVGNAIRRIKVQFGPDERTSVYQAAHHKRWIQVDGDLVRDGRQLSLRNPRSFFIVEPSDG